MFILQMRTKWGRYVIWINSWGKKNTACFDNEWSWKKWAIPALPSKPWCEDSSAEGGRKRLHGLRTPVLQQFAAGSKPYNRQCCPEQWRYRLRTLREEVSPCLRDTSKHWLQFQALPFLFGLCSCVFGDGMLRGTSGACFSLQSRKSCSILRYCKWSAAGLCQLRCGLVLSEGLLLIIVQLLVCLKEGIGSEITPAPFLPCVYLGAWQKGSCWCSGETKRVMVWKSVCFTGKSSSRVSG